MSAEQTSNLVIGLRLLAHPWLGAAGISDAERDLLVDAARALAEHAAEVEALRVALAAARTERDLWHREALR